MFIPSTIHPKGSAGLQGRGAWPWRKPANVRLWAARSSRARCPAPTPAAAMD